MLHSVLTLAQQYGFPLILLLVVLCRVDHYFGRLISNFSSISAALYRLADEIKSLRDDFSRSNNARR